MDGPRLLLAKTESPPRAVATRDAYGDALAQLGAEDPDIVVLDADLAKSTKTIKFAERFPERFFEVGIAEQNLMGIAAGLALAGKKPFVSTFAVFGTGRAFEPLRNSIAYPALNVKICLSHAGVTVGEDGGSHQTVEDIALMRSLPNLTVVVPADAVETAQAVRAIHAHHGPVYLRMGRPSVPVIFDAEGYRFRLGRATVLREGRDVALMACGIMVSQALAAAERLAAEGIEALVLNVSTVKPLDEETVCAAAARTGAVVTCEEHSVIGGLGSAVAEVLGERRPTPMERVGIKDVFGESGTWKDLLKARGLTPDDIVSAARRVLRRKAD